MEKSDYTTPRVFSLMRMMSHPRSLTKQFIHPTSEILLDDGVEILNCQFPYCSWMVSHPGQFPYCSWMVSYPGHGTRIARGLGMVQLLEMSIKFISQFLNLVPQEMSQHQNCKRCPSTSLRELLSLYF